METVTIDLDQYTPDMAVPVEAEYEDRFRADVDDGAAVAAQEQLVIVGMARNIGAILPHTINRLERIAARFGSWRAVVVENDSIDDTKSVLRDWAEARPGQVIADCRDLGREHLSGFERARVERYAEYRNRYREIAANEWPEARYTLAVDLDPWGGFSEDGILSSVAWMGHLPLTAAMASTSIYLAKTANGQRTWAHYDQWAYRQYSYTPRWDTYFLQWLPPPGTPPVRVFSAFGAACLYSNQWFYRCRYESIDGDIEHVGLHKHMADLGGACYLNPASRVLMHWMP
jgi:hypothetical protein